MKWYKLARKIPSINACFYQIIITQTLACETLTSSAELKGTLRWKHELKNSQGYCIELLTLGRFYVGKNSLTTTWQWTCQLTDIYIGGGTHKHHTVFFLKLE